MYFSGPYIHFSTFIANNLCRLAKLEKQKKQNKGSKEIHPDKNYGAPDATKIDAEQSASHPQDVDETINVGMPNQVDVDLKGKITIAAATIPEQPIAHPKEAKKIDILSKSCRHLMEDIFPWIEKEKACPIEEVLQTLLLTNPRFKDSSVGAKNVQGKLRDKTLLLDNPDVKRKRSFSRKSHHLKPCGLKPCSRKELQDLGVVNIKCMGITYEDVLPLHYIWKEYKDKVLESAVTQKDVYKMVDSMDLHGCYAVIAQAAEQRFEGCAGIIVKCSPEAYHIIEKSNRCIILQRRGSMIEFEIKAGKKLCLYGGDSRC